MSRESSRDSDGRDKMRTRERSERRSRAEVSDSASQSSHASRTSPSVPRRGRRSVELEDTTRLDDQDKDAPLNNPRDEARALGQEEVALNSGTDGEGVALASDTDYNASDLEVVVTDMGEHTDVGEHTDIGEHTDFGEHTDVADQTDIEHDPMNDASVNIKRPDMGSSTDNDPVAVAMAAANAASGQTAASLASAKADATTVNVGRLQRYTADPNVYAAIRAHRYNKRHEPRLDDYRDKRCSMLRYDTATAFYLMRSFGALLFRLTTFVVLSLAIGLTILCHYYKIFTDLPLNLLSVGIIFPISFGVQYNFGRRERILLDIASLKSSANALFVLSREWPPIQEYHKYSLKMSLLIKQLLRRISRYLAHHEGRDAHIQMIYHDFDEVSHLIEEIRLSDDWVRSVISRGYQYIRYMIYDFERLRIVSDFRTPSMFRAYSWAWLLSFPVLFAPFFANISRLYGLWAGIYASAIASLMLAMLAGVMNDMEDPFTGNGVDDLNTEMIREASYLMFPRKKNRYMGQQAKAKLREKHLKEKEKREKAKAEAALAKSKAKLESNPGHRRVPSLKLRGGNATDKEDGGNNNGGGGFFSGPLSPRFMKSPRLFQKKRKDAQDELAKLEAQMTKERKNSQGADSAPGLTTATDVSSDKAHAKVKKRGSMLPKSLKIDTDVDTDKDEKKDKKDKKDKKLKQGKKELLAAPASDKSETSNSKKPSKKGFASKKKFAVDLLERDQDDGEKEFLLPGAPVKVEEPKEIIIDEGEKELDKDEDSGNLPDDESSSMAVVKDKGKGKAKEKGKDKEKDKTKAKRKQQSSSSESDSGRQESEPEEANSGKSDPGESQEESESSSMDPALDKRKKHAKAKRPRSASQ